MEGLEGLQLLDVVLFEEDLGEGGVFGDDLNVIVGEPG